MYQQILVTGSQGFIGAELSKLLGSNGFLIKHFRDNDCKHFNILNSTHVNHAVDGVDGVIHLAGVSRIQNAVNNEAACWETNVLGTENIVRAIQNSPKQPWLLFSSSREVYGKQNILPVSEHSSLNPTNTYGISKLACETIINQAKAEGMQAAIVRYANVYGDPRDHMGRVIPTVCRSSLRNEPIRLLNPDHIFDFTHLKDVVEGTLLIVNQLEKKNSSPFPTLHLASGIGVPLSELALLIKSMSQSQSLITPITDTSAPHSSSFIGDPRFAKNFLGWECLITLRQGIRDLIAQMASNERQDSFFHNKYQGERRSVK